MNFQNLTSSKKLSNSFPDLESELSSISEDLLLEKNIDIKDYVFVLECKSHEKTLIRYVCQDPNCPNERFLCQKCLKESSHFEQHKAFIKDYQSYLEDKYEELRKIHDKACSGLATLSQKACERNAVKMAFKKAKNESGKALSSFRDLVSELKEKIKTVYHEIASKLFEGALSNYGKFVQCTDRDVRAIEEETLFINDNLEEVEKLLKSKIDHTLLERLITDYAPFLRNNGLQDILLSLSSLELRIKNFSILEKPAEELIKREFIKMVCLQIEKALDSALERYEKKEEKKEKKRVNIKNLIRNSYKQIHKPGKFSYNKSSLGKSTTRSVKIGSLTESKSKDPYWRG